MRHLSSHYQNKQIKNIVFLILILFASFVFFITLGLKIILFSSSTIANLFLKKKGEVVVQPTKEEKPLHLSVDNFPSATNSSSVQFSLSLRNIDLLTAYLNGKKNNQLEVKNSFTEMIIDNLLEGENEIYFKGENKKTSQSIKSDSYKIIYKKTKPKLEINSPKDEEKVNKEEIKIIGETEKETIININSQPVVVNSLGHFETFLKLKEGENIIEIAAEDIAGNVEKKTIKVFYEKEE